MKFITFKNNTSAFLIPALLILILHSIFLFYSGYFQIGLLADDYLNFAAANTSSIKEKFTSSIPYINNLHFRPLYYLSVDLSIYINQLLNTAKDNFIFFRIENLLIFYTLIFLAANLLFRLSGKAYYGLALIIICIFYANNLNDICWTVGKNDMMCGVFLIASLIFTFKYLGSRSDLFQYTAIFFFILGLLTKETAVIFPFISILLVYLAYNREKVYNLKNLFGAEIFILLIYSTFRIYGLGLQPSEVVTRFQKPGILTSINVSLKAFISLVIPFDYLTIQNYLASYNFTFLIYLFLLLLFLTGVIFIFVRTYKFKYLITLTLIFFISISPNLIAGYFRPQLILIPFILITLSLLLIADKMKINLNYYIVTLSLIMCFWIVYSFDIVREWKTSYQKSIKDIDALIELDMDPEKRNIVLGLPSRFGQSFILDYVSGAYNYRKYGKFEIKDNIADLVLTGALDEESLNSEIVILKYSGNEFDLSTSGITQYFLRVDATGSKYTDRDISYRLSGKNFFRKPTNLGLRMNTDSANVYVQSGDRFVKLNE